MKHLLSAVALLAILCLGAWGVIEYRQNAADGAVLGGGSSQILEKKTASATTTVIYMTPGRATTTLAFDTQEDGGFSADSAILAFQQAGSSTASLLDIDIEYSQDGRDWYRSGLSERATTTPDVNVGPVQGFRSQFASSTDAYGAVSDANSAISMRAITISVPARYVRAIFTVPIGSTNSAIWAQFVAKRGNR